MKRPGPLRLFRESLKTNEYRADELINIYILRPLAAIIVWLLYPTRVTPNQVTVAAIVTGCCAAGVYLVDTPQAFVAAGLLVTLKDILDDADGQLARAKSLYSRRGRFLDSIGDVFVNAGLFSAITAVLVRSHSPLPTILLGTLSFLGITLRVSYHVFYQVSFLHLEDKYKLNRIIEELTAEDQGGDQVALRLQVIFNILYTWQDKLMYTIDEWCKRGTFSESERRAWYGDNAGLRLSGLLGFGTEFAILTVCSIFNQLYLYLWLNVFFMNGIMLFSLLYRRLMLRRRVRNAIAMIS